MGGSPSRVENRSWTDNVLTFVCLFLSCHDPPSLHAHHSFILPETVALLVRLSLVFTRCVLCAPVVLFIHAPALFVSIRSWGAWATTSWRRRTSSRIHGFATWWIKHSSVWLLSINHATPPHALRRRTHTPGYRTHALRTRRLETRVVQPTSQV